MQNTNPNYSNFSLDFDDRLFQNDVKFCHHLPFYNFKNHISATNIAIPSPPKPTITYIKNPTMYLWKTRLVPHFLYVVYLDDIDALLLHV